MLLNCCHPPIPCIGMSGTLITGAATVTVVNSPQSRVGDVVLGGCGHIGIMVAGSATVSAEGPKIVRVGDPFVGCFTGVLVSGAPTVFST